MEIYSASVQRLDVCMMAAGANKPKYTHYDLGQTLDRPRTSLLYSLDGSQSRSFPTNIVQCLQLDHVTGKHQPKRYRHRYVSGGLARTKCLYSQNVSGHRGCVNAINFSHDGEEFLVSGGDDEKVLLWRVSDIMRGKCRYTAMDSPHDSNIFTTTFSCDNTHIYSGGNDANLIKHDAVTGKQISVHPHSEAVYCISAHPFSTDTILTASEDGLVRTIDTRLPHFTDDMNLVEDCDAFQCVTFNPVEPCLVATGNTRLGAALYDTRTRKKVFSYSSSKYRVFGEDVVSVNFSRDGRYLFTMQRRQPPYLYLTNEPKVAATFMDEKGEYMNVVSMKSGCFVGTDDEYVASGSDDFRVYIWKIPEDLETGQSRTIDRGVVPSPHLVLPGHRSIANQIRYSPTHHLLCSSGVEKIIKVWSHMPLSPSATLQHSGGPPSRKRYTHREFLQLSMGDESDMEPDDVLGEGEDRGVLAFFDALVNEEERGINLCDTPSSDDPVTPDSYLSDPPSSDDSFSDLTFPMSPWHSPADFMRYPYPDEEPGRATWDFMTPQERWDWHHGRRDWFYAEDGDDEGGSDETGSLTSGEPPSSENEMEGEGEGEGTGRRGGEQGHKHANGDYSDNERSKEMEGGDARNMRKALSSNSSDRKSKDCSLQESLDHGERNNVVTPSNWINRSIERGEGPAGDSFKPIPPVQFYSKKKQPPHPAQQTVTDTSSANGTTTKKRLCSQQELQNVPTTSSNSEAVGAAVTTCKSGGSESGATRKGKTSSRKGKRPYSNEKLPC